MSTPVISEGTRGRAPASLGVVQLCHSHSYIRVGQIPDVVRVHLVAAPDSLETTVAHEEDLVVVPEALVHGRLVEELRTSRSDGDRQIEVEPVALVVGVGQVELVGTDLAGVVLEVVVLHKEVAHMHAPRHREEEDGNNLVELLVDSLDNLDSQGAVVRVVGVLVGAQVHVAVDVLAAVDMLDSLEVVDQWEESAMEVAAQIQVVVPSRWAASMAPFELVRLLPPPLLLLVLVLPGSGIRRLLASSHGLEIVQPTLRSQVFRWVLDWSSSPCCPFCLFSSYLFSFENVSVIRI